MEFSRGGGGHQRDWLQAWPETQESLVLCALITVSFSIYPFKTEI